jgi:hypothetical protein
MQFLAWLETNSLAGCDAHFGAGAGIAANPGFAGADTENAESAQFDALPRGQGLLEALEDRIHRGFRFGPRQSGALDYMMDDVLFNQWGTLARATGLNVLRLTLLMLQDLLRIGNKDTEEERVFVAEPIPSYNDAGSMEFVSRIPQENLASTVKFP